MKNNKKILTITRTAIFLALLLVLQYVTKLTGIQLITGSVVNLILLLATFYCGIYGGLTIALISPILAYVLDITPLASVIIVPFIALGNMALILVFHVDNRLFYGKKYYVYIISAIVAILVGALIKMGIIWFGVLKVALPSILETKPEAAHQKIILTLTSAFTWTQFFTACIGGAGSLIITSSLKNIKA